METKKINEIAFRKGLRPINEGGINRILTHGKSGFIIISSNRSGVYSDDKNCDLSDEFLNYCKQNDKDPNEIENEENWLKIRNKMADKDLLAKLKASPYSYTPVFGGYHGQDSVKDSFEPSYIVYNHEKGGTGTIDHLNFDKLRDFGLELAKEYKQESIYVQAPNEPPVYLSQDGRQVSSTSSNNFNVNRDEKEFFTTIKRKKRDKDVNGLSTKPKRFTADINFESYYRKASPSTYFDRMKRRSNGEVFIDD